ncbi:hypothetical protein MACK_003520 [Theileria orientalis]|uniref:ABC transporter n=1 Tax=Theileria orientalis TaxID=68886 RepID=A0A976XHX5_THEOR|nr:hypothetical protein MACK_003520 [Theileria orientalis]
MNSPSHDSLEPPKYNPESCFWESEPYFKSYFKGIHNKAFTYYDDSNFFKYLFFHWVNCWVTVLCERYVEPYKIHPVQVSDQILKWEPIFSKHVSDGLVKLDLHEATKSSKKPVKPYRSILLRAILLTSWKKSFVLFLALVIGNVLSMSISILVEKLLQIVSKPSIHVAKTILLLLAIVGFQVLDGLLLENLNYHLYRMIYTFHYLYYVVPFRHSICHRRYYYNNVNGSNRLNTCNEVLHSCSPDSQCSKNPLFCPALRYQDKEMNPKIFTYSFYDSFYIAMIFEAVKFFMQFLTNFIYGVFLMSRHVKANLWVLYLAGVVFLVVMVSIEIFNAYIFKFILFIRDYKVTKYNDILGSLSIIKKMLLDDIGFNIITQTRNDELSLIFVKIFITFLNMCLFSTSINISFYIIKMYFVKSVNDATVVTDINPAAFLATFYIYMRIVSSMFLIPRAINVIGMGYISYKRVNRFLKNCSPTFYNRANEFTGPAHVTSELNQVTNKLPNDVVVYFKNATFTWVHSRNDLLGKNYELFLKNVNFELKRGEVAIVTGYQGSGKSNFIRSVLGEMTLVGGSMAVVPLHTSMPIFYASQDIYLQKGTVRSNITFGYRFDESLYNTVLMAVELQSDIAAWEKGDLRPVSDNALSLSGGQRVRVEMSRAIYAYLVFHKVNKEYNNGKCSFLMCLDASFHGLDPYVSKTIFNNLFNVKTGLLVRDDLSVVLTLSKQSLDICTKFTASLQFPNSPIYNVKNKQLTFSSKLHDFIQKRKHEGDFKYLTSARTGPYSLNSLTNDMVGLCLSGTNSKSVRAEVNKEIYQESFKTYVRDHLSGIKFNPYLVFMKPALFTFSMYILLTVALNALDYIKFVLSTNLSDYIIKNINDYTQGFFVDLDEVKSHSNSALKVTVIFVSIIIILSFLATLAISAGSLISCRKIHEYCINTLFNYSSTVIKIKKHFSQVITFLSGDLMMTDDITGLFIALLLFSFIQTATNIITLFYVIPISIPFIVVTMLIAYFYILKRYIDSTRSLNYGFLESLGHLNAVIQRSISGSAVYRTFNRDSDLLRDCLEQRDYNSRTKFMLIGLVSWSNIMFTWIFSLTTFIVLVFPIILDKYTKYKMTPGYFGLALSLCMNVVKSFSNFALMYSCAQMLMGSIERFQYFIPLGKRLKFDKYPNTHEEYVVNTVNRNLSSVDKKQLLRRRAIEFKAENKKLYGLRRLFYNPSLTILDSTLYLTPEHTGVEVKNLCVYTSQDYTPEAMILNNITAATHRSEIIGMVGRTGAGKTTILSSLQNIPAYRTGQVILDGKDLNEIPKVILRQIVGVLPQHPFVFRGWTVRRFLDPRMLFTDDEITRTLTQCNLMNFVNDLPGEKKLDTVIAPEDPLLYNSKQRYFSHRLNSLGSRSSMSHQSHSLSDGDMLLSYNQLRTLWFVRLVLYRNFFRVLLVDEPPEEDLFDTNVKNEDLGVPIYDLLPRFFGHCTTFVTAHDVNVLKKCSYVWVIHKGHLVKSCKTDDIKANESISNIIEESLNYV